MSRKRVAIVAGGRTPFVRAGRAFAEIDSLGMAVHAVRGMLDRSGIDPALIESVVFGTMTPDPLKPNLARELVFEAGLPIGAEAQTVASYCITGLRATTVAADAIAGGRIEVALAGGVDSLTRASLDLFREPSTGLTMGEHMELTVKEWDIPRQRQDEVALASHRNAVAAREKLAGEIHPLLGEEADSGPRADTSLKALATLKPVFDPRSRYADGGQLVARDRRRRSGAADERGESGSLRIGTPGLHRGHGLRRARPGRGPAHGAGHIGAAAPGRTQPGDGRHGPGRDPRGLRGPGSGQRGQRGSEVGRVRPRAKSTGTG